MSVTNIIGECPFCKRMCKEDEITVDEDKRLHMFFSCPCGADWDEMFALDYQRTDIIAEPEDEDEIDLDDEDEDFDFDDDDEDDAL